MKNIWKKIVENGDLEAVAMAGMILLAVVLGSGGCNI